jgi:WD40 repeat protein
MKEKDRKSIVAILIILLSLGMFSIIVITLAYDETDFGSAKIVDIDIFTVYGDSAWDTQGKYIAYCNDDYEIEIWDTTNKDLVKAITGHTANLNTVDWSPDGRYLASGSDDRTVKIWERDTWRCIHSIEFKRNASSGVDCVSWNPNGTYLAIGGGFGGFYGFFSYYKEVTIWDTSDWAQSFLVTAHNLGVNDLKWSHDGQHLASVGVNDNADIWNISDQKTWTSLKVSEYTFSLSWSHNDTIVVAGGENTNITVWDSQSDTLAQRNYGGTDAILCLAFSPDNKFLIFGSGHEITVLDGNDFSVIRRLSGHTSNVRSLSFAANGDHVASSSSDKSIRIWKTESWKCEKVMTRTIDEVARFQIFWGIVIGVLFFDSIAFIVITILVGKRLEQRKVRPLQAVIVEEAKAELVNIECPECGHTFEWKKFKKKIVCPKCKYSGNL